MAQVVAKLPGVVNFEPRKYLLSELKEDPDNVNEHSEIDLQLTGNSLGKFGQVDTLVVRESTKMVIGGNGRLWKMREMGWVDCWCFPVEGTDSQIRALSIALNKTGRNSSFNMLNLTAQLQAFQEADQGDLLALTGFQEHELGPLLAAEMHLPDITLEEPVISDTQDKKDLSSRGITIQFSVSQKPVVDDAIEKAREASGNFSLAPQDAIINILEEYIKQGDGDS